MLEIAPPVEAATLWKALLSGVQVQVIELIPKTWPLKLEAVEVGAVAVPGSLNAKTR